MVVFRILPSKYLHFIELSYLAYFMPLFFTNVKFEMHIYYQKIILILKKTKVLKFHAAIYRKTKCSREF